jgi:hypothetical protein
VEDASNATVKIRWRECHISDKSGCIRWVGCAWSVRNAARYVLA